MGKGNDPNCSGGGGAPMSALLAVEPAAAADSPMPASSTEKTQTRPSRSGTAATDPVLTAIVSALRQGSREEHERLYRQGLMLEVQRPRPMYGSGPSTPRYELTSLGRIVVEKGRLPTPTEIKRTIKALDRQLKQADVQGDVTSGGYSYSQPSAERARIEQRRLIDDRQSISRFRRCAADGQFEAVKIKNAAARAARDRLAGWLDDLAVVRTYNSRGLAAHAAKVRSGTLSVAEATEAVSATSSFVGAKEESVKRDAIRLGLGLPSEHQKALQDRAYNEQALRRYLDRIHAGEKLTSDHDEVAWSPRRVNDRRVRRAAFGYNATADRLGHDYQQQAIIELTDGTVQQVDVKRAHWDLEGYVSEVVDYREYEATKEAGLAEQESEAKKLLRRWARSAPPA